ncbi:alpha/beta hydrolase [Intrasporangium sp. DVR]|uniref:alpha/beta fold hydrolase n=1 Tax=Intrasporangium sp. DVR TaxID=3127867 RepID=UPI00313A586C
MSDPRPLVLLHGLGQSPIVWQDLVSALGAGRPMHAPWMVGLRPKDPIGFDLAAAAAGLAEELELQGIQRADVLGVSVGGSVAMHLAVERPDLVGRLVLAGPIVRPSAGALRMQKLALRLMPESKLLDMGVSRPRMLAVFDALRGFDGLDSIGRIAAPTLVVVGARDRVGIVAARQVVRAVAGARLETVEGGSSLLNADRPRELAELTRAFLDEGE